jgi:hypothetical protein
MLEHVHARCGDYHLLFPTENVGFIETRAGRKRMDRSEVVIDVRRLLGTAMGNGVAALEWRSTDGSRRATLIVDAVEEIVKCNPADLIAAPFLPPRLRPLCDCVMRGPDGRFHLRVKLDVAYPVKPQRPPATAEDAAAFSSDLNRLGDVLESVTTSEAVLV